LPYNSSISRTDAAAMVPEEVSNVMLANLQNESAVLSMARRIPVARNQTRFPVLSALPVAYWVNGDTGLKQTTEAAWANKYMNIEELAAIVPVPEAVFDDASFDIWGALRPLMEQAIGRSFDAAVFFGTSAPSSFPTNLVAAAVAAGNYVARGTNATAALGLLAADLSDLMATLEADGYDATGAVANTTMKARLRNTRDSTGQKIDDISSTDFFGAPIQYPMRGQWPTGSTAAEMVVGDFNNLIVGVRQDITYKILDQAVIQDASGNIVFNLAQQDMVALRVVFRAGWVASNPINYDQGTEASRYPFAVLRAP
jgi:HK97 family phage major capsid protein